MLSEVEQQIVENALELKFLGEKIYKNNYELAQEKKLQEQRRALASRKAELELSARAQLLMQDDEDRAKYASQALKQSLAREYQHAIQSKQQREQQSKVLALSREREWLAQSAHLQAEERRLQLERKSRLRDSFTAESREKQLRKKRETEQVQVEKERFRKQADMAHDLGKLKEENYRLYYRPFEGVLPPKQAEDGRESAKAQLRRSQEGATDLLLLNHQQTQLRRQHEQSSTNAVLEFQLREKEDRLRRRQAEAEKEANESVRRKQLVEELEHRARELRKEEQRHYDSELSKQVTQHNNRLAPTPSLPQLHHNPITNPIGFKIDPSNKYLVREYEQAKAQAVGDRHLRLDGLARLATRMS